MSRLSAYEEALDEDIDEDIGDTEEGDIIAKLQASHQGALYEDGAFPAHRSSLYRWVGNNIRVVLLEDRVRGLNSTDTISFSPRRTHAF